MKTAPVLLGALLALGGSPRPAVAADGTPVHMQGSDGQPYAAATARVVQSIVEYTRWPNAGGTPLLCTVGAAQRAGRFDSLHLADGRPIQHRQAGASAAGLAGCQVVYIGQMSGAAMRQVTALVRGKGVLTIAENDPAAESEAMFSLVFLPDAVSFRLNIDAISRSGLRVDPRVLRMARGGL